MLSRRHLLTGATLLAASAAIPRAWAQAPTGPFKLDPLPYAPSKNEPHIDAQTMEIHHDKHHAAYVNNLNAALAQNAEAARMPLQDMLANLSKVPESIRTAVRNNGGGHANHTMFWQIMGGQGGEPAGDVKAAIDRDLGGFQKFQTDFNTAGEKQFGSGWVFVTVSRDGKLALTTRPNQDTPLMDGQRVLMGNDVWEHAYYLKYQNRRPEYLKAWWNVLDWNRIGERYAAAKAGTLTI
ncbi:superoxide dismutase [Microvirga lotononidis]|uniref:Superoxide dismutase n=1 Tax=Microvirga lotononidis TaxID=864069 RepID=I4YQ61_9HYPH|nr:superoxide dismutase [Microvirga lotononidis]EIM26103.1 superoxide dismutase [Microvirga lotononidis]WQO26008.1 superoxide dismutase [Microvirga lotononidis]